MSSIPNLNNLASIARFWRGKTPGKKSFKFNGSNGYVQQVWYSWGVVSKLNDGTRDYRQCYWGYFNIWDNLIHGLDNRSVQTQKFVFQLDDLLNNIILCSYNGTLWIQILTDWRVQVETQWTWSMRYFTVNTLTAWVIYNLEVRVNNALPAWTARVAWDIDIFLNWVKQSLTTTSFWTTTTTNSLLFWWAYTTALPQFNWRWRLYNFSLRNRALSDAECAQEWLSNWANTISSWLINRRDTNNTSQAISRTWYNLTWSGNYSVATDGNGKHIYYNWNYRRDLTTWTVAWHSATWFPVSNTTSFTAVTKFKLISASVDNNTSWLFWINAVASIYITWNNNAVATRITNWWSFTDVNIWIINLNQTYTIHMVYNASEGKQYTYLNWVLQNTWWSSVWFAFSWVTWVVWDSWVWGWNFTSSWKQIYHARVRARALTQSDINADIALWNNTNNDPTIVASYTPDTLINWQGVASPSDYTSWAKTWTTTTTSDTTVAPDWTTTADTVMIVWTATQWIEQFTTTLTWSSLASKTFIVKAFVKVDVWTAMFRIKNTHRLVTDYFSANLTATTTWQEFTFTQTFSSSTAWTWVTYWIINDTVGLNPILKVRNVRLFLVNEILYDNSLNIGGYVWPLSNRYISWWIKPWVDALNDANGNPIMNLGYWYSYIRNTSNWIRIRFDNRISASESSSDLWAWFRNWVHFIGWVERDWTNFRTKVWINWVAVGTDTWFLDASHSLSPQVQVLLWKNSTRYFTWSMRNNRILTSPTALTDAQALMIVNWWDPAWVTKVLHRDALWSDTTNYVTDKSGNGRVGYITGWVTKTFN